MQSESFPTFFRVDGILIINQLERETRVDSVISSFIDVRCTDVTNEAMVCPVGVGGRTFQKVTMAASLCFTTISVCSEKNTRNTRKRERGPEDSLVRERQLEPS